MFTAIPQELAEDPWFKIVEFLQHNWAVIIDQEEGALVVFFGDTCGVFDEILFDSTAEAEAALARNGFSKYREDERAQEFVGLPRGEFRERAHPNGRIYSGGRFWR